MTRRSKRCWYAAGILGAVVICFLAFEMFLQSSEEARLRASYEKVQSGMTVAEAEAVLGLKPATLTTYAHMSIETLDDQTEMEVKLRSLSHYYPAGEYGVYLYYDQSSQVTGKALVVIRTSQLRRIQLESGRLARRLF